MTGSDVMSEGSGPVGFILVAAAVDDSSNYLIYIPHNPAILRVCNSLLRLSASGGQATHISCMFRGMSTDFAFEPGHLGTSGPYKLISRAL